jgi:hypothetical protein
MQGKKKTDTFIAGPTADRTERVGMIPSTFAGGEDHFGGTKFASLPEPRPVDAELTPEQTRQMTRRAIELGNVRQGGLDRIVGRDDWTLLLVGRGTDPNVVAAVVELLRERQRAKRLTIASRDRFAIEGAEFVDLANADAMEMPAPGVWSRRDVTYRVPAAVLHCDRLISVTPLRMTAGRPSLAIDNYRDAAQAHSPAAGLPDTVAIDLFGFHVADYAVLGGTQIFRDGKATRHNLVIAGASAVAVDTVGAAVLGFKPAVLPLLQVAARRGYGEPDAESIWTRGVEIEDARPKLPTPRRPASK